MHWEYGRAEQEEVAKEFNNVCCIVKEAEAALTLGVQTSISGYKTVICYFLIMWQYFCAVLFLLHPLQTTTCQISYKHANDRLFLM